MYIGEGGRFCCIVCSSSSFVSAACICVIARLQYGLRDCQSSGEERGDVMAEMSAFFSDRSGKIAIDFMTNPARKGNLTCISWLYHPFCPYLYLYLIIANSSSSSVKGVLKVTPGAFG